MLSSKATKSAPLVCILAGSPSADNKGARLMKAIKQQAPDTKFMGLGGPRMENAGLKESYGNINTFLDKPFFPYRNFLRFHIERIYHPLMFPIHWQNRKQLKNLQASGFYQEVLDKKPDVFLTVGNEFFTSRLYTNLNETYFNNDALKPPSIFYTNLIINQRHEFKDFQDHILYTCPKEPVNWKYFKFPSTFVGIDGVSRAYKYLYRNSEKFKSLARTNSLLLSHEYHRDITEELILAEKLQFRAKHKIPEHATVLYLAPGDVEREIKWSVPLFNKTMKTFLQKDGLKGVAEENFAVVISSTEDSVQTVRSAVNALQWPCHIVITENDDQKFAGMAASDMGFALNGELIYECAVMQLPIIAASCINVLQTYYTLLYNFFNVDLNILLEGDAFPEIFGQYFPSKIAEVFEEWHKNPKLKYQLLERFDSVLPQLLPLASANASIESHDTQRGDLTKDNLVFTEHLDSDFLAAKKTLEAAEIYLRVKDEKAPYHVLSNRRKEILKDLRWD